MSKIQYLLNTKTGEEFTLQDILGENSLSLKEFRIEWKKYLLFKKPLYICGNCKQPLLLKGKPRNNKELYIAHLKGSKACKWKYEDEKDYLEKLKEMFHNVRESEEHKQLKSFITKRLEEDENFKNIKSEKRFKNNFTDTYKVPDVSAIKTTYKKELKVEKRIVFEIQLTSTFLDVIIEREKFYYENNSNLIWIFADFSKDLSKTKMTEDDILFTSKKNVFILDEEAKNISIKNNSLYLKNIHLIPILDNNGEIDSKWSDSKILNIDEIIFDSITGKSFIYNFEYQRTRLLFEQKIKNKNYKTNWDLIKFYIDKSYKESIHFGSLLRENVFNPKTDEHLIEALHKSQKIIGYIFEIIHMNKDEKYIFVDTFSNTKDKDNRIIKMLHNALNPAMQSNKFYIDIIIKAIDYYGKSEFLISLDKKGKLIEKIQMQRKYIIDDLPSSYQTALEYLFPELFFITNIPKKG